jgi:hypothetical protein
MKEPDSKLPWRLELIGDYEHDEEKYEVFNSNKNPHFDSVMHNENYYNRAPSLQDAEYIVEACNNYPEAIELLRDLSIPKYDEYMMREKIEQFLNKVDNEFKTD